MPAPSIAELQAQATSLAAPHLPFTERLPKLELHAHLTGSITPATLQSIWEHRKARDPSFPLAPPSEVLMPEEGFDVVTFFPLFDSYIYNLIDSIETLRQATRKVLEAFAADGVVHLELRTGPRSFTGANGESASEEAYLRTVLSELHAWNAQATRVHGNGGMRAFLILSVDRAKSSPARAEDIVELVLKLRNDDSLGKLIVGLDLGGNPLKGDVLDFRPAFLRAKDAGLGLALHFAETKRSAKKAELEELLSWEPARLGHCVHVPAYLREGVLKRGVGVEVCLSCNLLAGLSAREEGWAGHRAREWLGGGGKVVFCTDDVGVFGSEGSKEWGIAMGAFGLDRRRAVDLCLEGVEVVFGGREERERLRRCLDEFARTEVIDQGAV
ncbi:MAG: hypothetical protein MMC23_004060 [Stictis urceolatum]|nr:hypothetical protein [Stictis urceolata]